MGARMSGKLAVLKNKPVHDEFRGPTITATLQLLTVDERANYWDFAAEYAREINHGGPTYKSLCIAVKDVESQKAGARGGGAMPRSARDLSKEYLSRAVNRFRDRLLSSAHAEQFLAVSICRWVQISRQDALNAFLDSLACPRDLNGNRKGEIPEFDPEDAAIQACRLALAYSAHDLAVVCAALMLSSSDWNSLDRALAALTELPYRPETVPTLAPTSINAKESSEPEPMTTRDEPAGPSVNLDALQQIRNALAELRLLLNTAVAAIDDGVVPDLTTVIAAGAELRGKFLQSANQLGVPTLSIAALAVAFEARDERTRIVNIIVRCRSISHMTDKAFSAQNAIRDKCDELENSLLANGTISGAEQALLSLVRLINEGETLSDEDAAQLQAEVEEVFGRAVAAAAVRGKLTFATPALAEADDNERVSDFAADHRADKVDHGKPLESFGTQIEQSVEVTQATSAKYVNESGKGMSNAAIEAEDAQSRLDANVGPGHTKELALAPEMDDQAAVLRPGDAGTTEAGQKSGRSPSEQADAGTSEAVPSFQTFDEFSRAQWVDSSGTVATAPWNGSEVPQTLAIRSIEAWQQGKLSIAFLFARAAHAFGVVNSLDLDDLASADEVLSMPESPSAGRNPARADRLRQRLAAHQSSKNNPIALGLMLEALRPTLPCTLTTQEVESLIQCASYNDSAFEEVLKFLLVGWAAQLNPLLILRSRLLNAPQESTNELKTALVSAQASLKTVVATLWSAAGGKIQRTHCRAAWTRFVEDEVAPLRNDLAPSDHRLNIQTRWTRSKISVRVVEMGRAFKRIMDARGVKHSDRTAAENAAQQIVEAIDRVAVSLERLAAHQGHAHSSYDGVPQAAGLRLLSGAASDATERLSALLFSVVLREKPAENPVRLPAGYLIDHIDVVKYLKADVLTQQGVAQNGIPITSFENPIPAAMLLKNWNEREPVAVANDVFLSSSLRDIAAATERRDILTALSNTDVLQPHERTLLHSYALQLQDDAFGAAKQLESIWGDCNELMCEAERPLRVLVKDALSLTDAGSAANASITTSLLLLAWLRQTVEQAVKHRRVAADALIGAARERSDDLATRVQTYFDADDFRSGVALFHNGEVPKGNSDRLAGRRTILRDDAIKKWEEPRTKLVEGFKGSTADVTRVTDLWTTYAPDASQLDGLPKLFYAVISGEAGRSINENQKRFPVRLADLREHKERKTVVNCETIRSYFQKSKLNPTFLPQLAEFSQIVIMSSPHRTSYGSSVLDDWSKAVISEAANSLAVFLAPGIPRARRDDLVSSFRKRGIPAAIIDDVDLCRLYAATAVADGHDFIPFLEVLLEQFDLERASPFSSLDGQHVRLETYVGRTQEANRVALGGSYTRIFSGRKLGKSALLKYVANTFDGYQLPSGNELSVFFITIAGGESERWVVDCILDEMTNRFGLQEATSFKEQSPAVRFSNYMKRFLSEKPRHSLLLILDEADAFVEGQLARYDTDREGSLSFRMMKELPAQVDANELPRIRTIFSGYRVTNTRGGVWANAGDVLVLRPLAEEEAIHFLQGMLARIGIVLGSHAPFVAMRCGFQPAVLIRFGENLVKRLKRSTRSASRETLLVTHDEVLATLAEPGVLDEIKTVVNNNFQGNRIGAVVFGAMLLALKELEPGLALTDGPTQVLAKLREIDEDLDWLERIDASPLAKIEQNLRDFIDRELLTVSDAPQFGVREYRLRFPHFLPVLTQQSEIALEVRQQIQAIRAGAFQRRLSECVLSESALEIVRYWYHQETTDLCKLVIVGGHWMSALTDAKCGLPDRLGSESQLLGSETTPKSVSTFVEKGIRVFCAATVEQWLSSLVSKTERPLVLIGGVDLQRAARRYALSGGDVPVETIALGRLTEATLGWWFEDARALHFKKGDAIVRIAHATELVPYIAAAFDRLLSHAPGSDVTEEELEVALRQLEESLPETAARLGNAAGADGLTPREIRLLKMAVQVAEEGIDEFDLEREFPEFWALSGLAHEDEDAPLSNAEDWSALKMLIDLGLLPQKTEAGVTANSRSLGRVRFNKSGILLRLIKALEPADAS